MCTISNIFGKSYIPDPLVAFYDYETVGFAPQIKIRFGFTPMESKMYHFQCCYCHFSYECIHICQSLYSTHYEAYCFFNNAQLVAMSSERASYFEVIFVIWQLIIDCCGRLSLSILLFLFTCKQLRSCKQLLPFYLMNVSVSLFHY